MKSLVSTIAAVAYLAGAAGVASANVGVLVLSDNFDADAQTLNWAGDSVFASTGAPASTDLIGTGFFDLYPGHGNYVDLDGSTQTGVSPAGQLTSALSFGPWTYTLNFDLGGNAWARRQSDHRRHPGRSLDRVDQPGLRRSAGDPHLHLQDLDRRQAGVHRRRPVRFPGQCPGQRVPERRAGTRHLGGDAGRLRRRGRGDAQ